MSIEARTENVPTSTDNFTEAKPTPTISGILDDLENGLNNEAMAEKYGVPADELATLRKHHPALKGKRTKKVKKVGFTFVDDSGVNPDELPLQVAGSAIKAESSELPADYQEEE